MEGIVRNDGSGTRRMGRTQQSEPAAGSRTGTGASRRLRRGDPVGRLRPIAGENGRSVVLGRCFLFFGVCVCVCVCSTPWVVLRGEYKSS